MRSAPGTERRRKRVRSTPKPGVEPGSPDVESEVALAYASVRTCSEGWTRTNVSGVRARRPAIERPQNGREPGSRTLRLVPPRHACYRCTSSRRPPLNLALRARRPSLRRRFTRSLVGVGGLEPPCLASEASRVTLPSHTVGQRGRNRTDVSGVQVRSGATPSHAVDGPCAVQMRPHGLVARQAQVRDRSHPHEDSNLDRQA